LRIADEVRFEETALREALCKQRSAQPQHPAPGTQKPPFHICRRNACTVKSSSFMGTL
jgi:hypothetical protein